MTRIDLLEAFCDFTCDATADIIMPTRLQKGDTEQVFRAAEVYRMRLPDGTSAQKKAPYIIHQILAGKDTQTAGHSISASVTVRSIFCVYNENEEEGGLMLLNLMERLRIALLERVVLEDRYQIDLAVGLETLVYSADTAPYFAGEMASTWKIPVVERAVEALWQQQGGVR